MTSSRFAIVLVALAGWPSAREVSAQVLYDWINPSGGSYHSAVNWFPGAGAPPGPNDGAGFGLAAKYTVDFFSDATISDVDVFNGDVTFDLNPSGTERDYTVRAVQVTGFSSTPRLTVRDGTMYANTMIVSNGGQFAGATWGAIYARNLTVTGAGSTWASAVWPSSTWTPTTLNITSGGNVWNIGGATIGLSQRDGTAIVSGAGSRWTLDYLEVGSGWDSTGELTIEAGGVVSSTDGVIGSSGFFIPAATGTVTVTGAGSRWENSFSVYVGGYFNSSGGNGTLEVKDGGVVAVAGALQVWDSGTLRGDGLVEGNVSNAGTVAPGTSPGTLHIDGNYSQAVTGKLLIELAAADSCDKLDITGNLTLDGTLGVSLLDSFAPAAGDLFDILDWSSLSGTFSTLELPALAAGLGWDTSQLYTSGLLSVIGIIPGDYNNNGTVDAADYVVWRKSPSNFGGNPDGYNTWRANFGEPAGGGSRATANAAVPEPSNCCLLCCAAIGVLVIRQIQSRDEPMARATFSRRPR
jgi:T5SS/PEP-CTERM-associated repeat protein